MKQGSLVKYPGLKPCPFCGRRAIIVYDRENFLYQVKCSTFTCGAKAPKSSVSPRGARKIWNRRWNNEGQGSDSAKD